MKMKLHSLKLKLLPGLATMQESKNDKILIVERKCDMVCEHIVFHSRKFSAARQQLVHSAAAASASHARDQLEVILMF